MESRIFAKPILKMFPPSKEDEVGYMIVSYHAKTPNEVPIADENGDFIAKGPLLPYSSAGFVELTGTFCEDYFACSDYTEYLDSEDMVKGFLETLAGYKTTDYPLLFNCFGENLIQRLDLDSSQLLTCGLPESRAIKLARAYDLRRSKKSTLIYLLKFKLPVEDAIRVANVCDGLLDLKCAPFKYALQTPLPYFVAKKIAVTEKIKLASVDGAAAAILDILKQSEGVSMGRAFQDTAVGNTYCRIEDLLNLAAKSAELESSSPLLKRALLMLLKSNICICAQGKYIYRKATAEAEYGIAKEALRIRSAEIKEKDYRLDIYRTENKKKMRLAPEQRNAVKVVLNNAFTLLIGGPGTGKTTIEQVIIQIYRHYHPGEPVLLIAPTGKAARRMSESTGEPACTIHKALGVDAGEEVISSDVKIEAGLILVDEASMIDSQVCVALFKAVQKGSQIVLVGDTNQLPSVGAGNVLAELIASEVFPIAKLETVYRQKDGSTIAVNCAKIKHGTVALDYSETFLFVETSNQSVAVEKIRQAYCAELEAGLGIEDICVLSPYRKSTPTGVNQLNPLLQQMVVKEDTPFIKYGKRCFYLGDKVMCMSNRGNIANGDVGYISGISGSHFLIDYKDGREERYSKRDLRDFDLAYACTIHKSQGSEYKTCIIIMMDEHKSMLKRNLIYTAVSRAKNKVIIIGTKSALQISILTEDVTMRKSRLGEIAKRENAKK